MPTALQASINKVPAGATICLPSTVIVTFFTSAISNSTFSRNHWQLFHTALCFKGASTSLQVCFELVAPFIHDRHRWNSCRVAQRTECSSEHVLRQVFDVIDVLLQPTAIVEASKSFL